MTSGVFHSKIIRLDYHPSYQGLIDEMVRDELAALAVNVPYRWEDQGIGAYEAWGFRGIDYRPVPVMELNEDTIEVWIPKNQVDDAGGEEEFLFGDEVSVEQEIGESNKSGEVRVVAKFDKSRWDTKLFQNGDPSQYYVGNYRLWQE